MQTRDADPPIDENAPSIGDVKEAVAKLRGGKAAGICNISAELLKAGGGAMYSIQVPFSLTGRRGWSSLSGRGMGTVKTATTTVE